jgi:hypothetical protein
MSAPTRTELISSWQQLLWWQGLQLVKHAGLFAFKCPLHHCRKFRIQKTPEAIAGTGNRKCKLQLVAGIVFSFNLDV